jgi:putative NADH-flavin reductase
MKIVVYGGTGSVGSAVVAEAASRGHDTVAVSRTRPAGELPPGATWRTGDAEDLESVRQSSAGADAVVTAFGPSRVPGEDPQAYVGTLLDFLGALRSTRVLVVGGAGSLEAAPGVRLLDTPDFPPEYKPESSAAADALARLRTADVSVDWTYLSPAPVIGPGERTGSYRVGDDTPAGSFISYADFAVAVVDELEKPAHPRARFTVATS